MIRPCFGVLLLICLTESTDYRRCHHNRRRKELRCSGSNLGAVPANLPADLVKLEIKNDDLSSGFEFPELIRLRKLYLTNVNIGNELPKLTFAKLRNLQELRIQYLPRAPENYTVTIHPEAFHMLGSLSTVRLYNLGIRELPEYMFKHSRQLKYIYINGMTIDTIRSNTFAPLERVQLLSFVRNEISTIEEGSFDCMDPVYRATRIFLSDNKLRTIPPDIDSRIEISIHDNPIVCDCKLVIPRNFNDRRAKCEEPPSLKDIYIMNLKGKAVQCGAVSEKKKCDKFSIYMGSVTKDGAEMTTSTKFEEGDVATITCNEGYEFDLLDDEYLTDDKTQATLTCIEGEDYNPPEIPMCFEKKKKCDKFSIYMGSVTKDGAEMTSSTKFEEGDVATITCNEGYEFDLLDDHVYLTDDKTQATLTCIEGDIYDPPEIPMCFEIIPECELTPIENVAASPGWTVLEDSTITLSCEEGYEGEQEIIQCQYGGIFEDPQIQCEERGQLDDGKVIEILEPCEIPRIRNGWATFKNERVIAYGEEVFVICDQPNYGPAQTRVTCIGNNRWDPPLPRCTWEGPTCEFPTVANGVVSPQMDVVMPWTFLTITCNEGFEKNPNVNVECIHSWEEAYFSNRIPVCERIKVN